MSSPASPPSQKSPTHAKQDEHHLQDADTTTSAAAAAKPKLRRKPPQDATQREPPPREDKTKASSPGQRDVKQAPTPVANDPPHHQQQQAPSPAKTLNTPAARTPKPPPPPAGSHPSPAQSAKQAFEESIAKPAEEALQKFFYPPIRSSYKAAGQVESPPRQKHKSPAAVGQGDLGSQTSAAPPHPVAAKQPAVAQANERDRPSAGTGADRRPLGTVDEDNNDGAIPDVSPAVSNESAVTTPSQEEFDEHFRQQEQEDNQFVSDFWHIYDDLIILSLFTQLGIVARLGSSLWFSFFDNVFSNNSALFVNLPLNCCSCFILGLLCSGSSLMEIITTRFSPPRLQQQIQTHKLTSDEDDDGLMDEGGDEEEEEGDDTFQGMNRQGSSAANSADSTASPRRRGRVRSTPSSRSGSPVARRRQQSSDSGDSSFVMGNAGQWGENSTGIFRRRRRGGRRPKHEKQQPHAQRMFRSWQPPLHLNEDLRDVQLLALERRIRQSKCLLLFPVQKEDVDVMEHYFDDGYKKQGQVLNGSFGGSSGHEPFDDEVMDGLYLQESSDDDENDIEGGGQHTSTVARASPKDADAQLFNSQTGKPAQRAPTSSPASSDPLRQSPSPDPASGRPAVSANAPGPAPHASPAADDSDHVELHGEENPNDLNQIVNEVSANVTENLSRLRRVNIANGWDVGTTAEDMSDDLMLGLRFGFCGALSSFSSWNSAMINLIRSGKIGEAFVGYMLGLQLPIIAYRFGQHVAVYIFVWRCRQETRRDERRGYGIQLHTQEDDEDEDAAVANSLSEQASGDHRSVSPTPGANSPGGDAELSPRTSPINNKDSSIERQTPSIRAVITVLFMMAVVTQCTSISFYSEPQNQVVALSLLFSPLGVLTRWRLSKYNAWRPTFPIGTFTCNMLACALSGGLGRLLAGNPNEEERLVLVSLINGFGGTLSSVANFIVEILAGMDPILFRFDGMVYALWSLFWAMIVGFVFSASADWADETSS